MALLAVADVYAGEQCCRQGGNLVIETIMARRSVRMYKDMPVERCKLQKIVECGINAPSGMNKQPWQVRVVDSRDYIDGITGVSARQIRGWPTTHRSRICFATLRR